MKNSLYYQQFLMFGLMFAIGVFMNPMNMLIYRFDHFYISLTLIYSGLFMASIMIWAHQILHYLNNGHLNLIISLYGIAFTFISFFLLIKQLFGNITRLPPTNYNSQIKIPCLTNAKPGSLTTV